MLTKEQFLELRKKGLSVEQISSFERGEKPVQQQVVNPNMFERESKGFFGKARDFATDIVGGGKLAEGAGLAIAAPKAIESLENSQKQASDIELNLVKRIRQKREAGEDTVSFENALKQLMADRGATEQTIQAFINTLPTNKEVIGSSVRLAGSLVAPTIGKGAVKATGLGKGITGIGSGISRGFASGAVGGGIEGTIQGVGFGLEDNKDALGVAKSGLFGGTVGAITGGVVGGAFGGLKGRVASQTERKLGYITPEPKDMTPKQWQELVKEGKVSPKSSRNPAQYVMSRDEIDVAQRYQNVIDKDPVKTTLNINEQIGTLDDEVGSFLKKNNGIFNKGELRNRLANAMSDIDDISLAPERIAKAKGDLVDNFVSRLQKGDLHSLWQHRKLFDQQVENIFRGSPTTQKQIKLALRNAVQDYISENTPNGYYKGLMKDMSKLFDLRDTVAIKASKERGSDAIELWLKNHPKIVKVIGGAALLGFGSRLLPGGGDTQ